MNALQLLTVGTLLIPLAAGGDAANAELKKLQGAWTLERLEFNGKEVTDMYKIDIAIKDGVIAVAGEKDIEEDYGKIGFKVDPRTTPRCIDFTVAVGGKKGTKLEGIYQLKDNTLTFCIQVLGTDRPVEFKSPSGSSAALVVFKRKNS